MFVSPCHSSPEWLLEGDEQPTRPKGSGPQGQKHFENSEIRLWGPVIGKGDRYAKDSRSIPTGLDVKEMPLGRTLPAPMIQTSFGPSLGKNIPPQGGRGVGKVGVDWRPRGNKGTPVWVRGHRPQGAVRGNQLSSGHFIHQRDQGAKEPPSKAAWRAGHASTGKTVTRHELEDSH